MARGRDQRGPMERLVRVAAALSAQPKYGVDAAKLVTIAGFKNDENGHRQLQRDLEHLAKQGWQIENISGAGTGARYGMVTQDNRLKVRLSLPQATALQRAALVARRSDLVTRLGLPEDELPETPPADLRVGGESEALDAALEAVRLRALLRFRYKGSPRLTQPQSVSQQNGKWYLRAIEEGSETMKTFMVARMSDVVAEDPGTARHVPVERHLTLHPMQWEVDAPVEVMLRTDEDFRQDVVRWLQEPLAEEHHSGTVDMRYRVTNRTAFRDRIYELGTRVELLGPSDVREELLSELEVLARGGTS
ncbi:MAG: WYL domain-containing protein [Nocardioides sp.]|nr:WYL domain-containing protein [Nocardioides sp.]